MVAEPLKKIGTGRQAKFRNREAEKIHMGIGRRWNDFRESSDRADLWNAY